MKVVIAGASGLIGSRLLAALRARGDEAVALPRFGTAPWNVEGVDAVVNLAGASVAGKRWSEAYKKELTDSRILPTRALVEAIRAAGKKPRVLVNASAVGFYGDGGDELVTESSPPGKDFLAGLVKAWEAEAAKAPVRTVMPRTGIVLAPKGGALEKMVPPFKAFIGGPIGSGKQWFPWIHIQDEVDAILFCIDHQTLQGPVNLAAPGIVNMKDFSKALGRALHRPSWTPVPAPALRLAVGEFAEALLSGQRAVPKKLESAGFKFKFANLDAALSDLFP
ncbi:MAG TPA: TIGR01777 family oxidoreductase [Myxococcales bacterium]|nr:TIGR01777 family oxidoreductase [Myxococcales bacterium]